MPRSVSGFLSLLVCLSIQTVGSRAQSDWYPFTLPWDDSTKTFVDSTHLLQDFPGQEVGQIIDSRGFVRTNSQGHFIFEKTRRRAKFWGVNFVFNANFPDHTSAEKVARRLAKLGINVVRFHHMDFYESPNGIFDPSHYPNDTQHLDVGQLDRWDYLVYQLRKNGIYVNINLKVARHFGPGDGLEETNRFTENRFFRGISHVNPRMIELQQDYARQLLLRRNPYTGLTYAEDPVVFCIEIANEDSLFGSMLTDGEINFLPDDSTSLPLIYSEEIDEKWNRWLEERYGSEAELRTAWDPGGDPVDDRDMMRNGDFENGLADWTVNPIENARVAASVVPGSGPDGSQALRVVVTSDGVNWHVQATQNGHSIESGKRYEVSFYARSSSPGGLTIDVMKGAPPWQNYGLSKRIELTRDWRLYRGQFVANETDLATARPTFELGESNNTIWLDKVQFRQVNPVVLDPDESLSNKSVRRQLRSDLGRYSDQRSIDLFRFYAELDTAYFTGMMGFLKETLGIQSLVTGTAPWWAFLGDIEVQSKLDFVDGHLYWDHPWWPSAPAWSPGGWIINNRPFINKLEEMGRLATLAVEGKPFTVSEYNEVFPNQHALEGPIIAALVANQQDWDAVYLFDYAGDTPSYQDTYTTSFFSLAGNPVKTGQMPVASRIFLGSQNSPSKALTNPSLNLEQIYLGFRSGHVAAIDFLASVGLDKLSLFGSRLRIRDFDSEIPVSFSSPSVPSVIESDHRELRWNREDLDRTFLQIHGPAVQGGLGFLEGRNLDLGVWSFRVVPGGPDFGAILLQSWNSVPLRETQRMLFSVWTEHANTGMVWNSSHNSVDDRWGRAPTIIQPIQVELSLDLPGTRSLSVYALDERGQRKAQISVHQEDSGAIDLLIDTSRDKTFWYEFEINEPSATATYGIEASVLFQLYTSSDESDLDFGWIETTSDASTDSSVLALIEYYSKGDLTSVVQIPATIPVSSWRFPVVLDDPTSTAVALVNPNLLATVSVGLTLTNRDGTAAVSTSEVTLGPGEVRAAYINELVNVTDPFEGILSVEADQPIATVALRSTTNKNGQIFLTPVPIQPPSQSALESFFAQLAISNSYSTDLILFNPTTETIRFQAEYFESDGSISDASFLPSGEVTLQPGEVVRSVLRSTVEQFYGYGRLTHLQGPGLPQAVAVVTQWSGQLRISEVAIPALPKQTKTSVLVPERINQSSALALLNPNASPISIEARVHPTAEYPDLDLSTTIQLAPGERKSLFFRELLPSAPVYTNTVLSLESTEPFGYLSLLGIFNKRGTFLLSSLVADGTGDTTTVRVIGRFLTGSGFRTNMFIFGDSTDSGSISFFDIFGAPSPLSFR